MEIVQPASLFFHSAEPAVLRLPHLITFFDSDLLGKITHTLKCRPGLWSLPAPFDDEDRYDYGRESAALAAWAWPLNQAELLGGGRYVAEAFFGVKLMILDSTTDEALLNRLAVPEGQRLDTGAYVTDGYQDLPTLAELMEHIGWALIPIGAERSQGLFLTSAAKAECVTKLCEWCDRQGRDHATVQRRAESLVLAWQRAPAQHRDTAMAHRIDVFLGDLEARFGEADGSLPVLVQQRLASRRALEAQIEHARLPGQSNP